MTNYTTPGQYIADLLVERGWTQRTLAIVLEKDESTINKILAGKGVVTTETAIALEEVFGVPAEDFLELQRKYDLAVARISMKPDKARSTRATLFGDLPIAAMIKRGWLQAKEAGDLRGVEQSLIKFFGAASVDDIEVLPHAAKRTIVSVEPTAVQLAWLYRVRAIAEELLVAKFTPQTLDAALTKLSALTSAPEESRKIPRILAEAGIRFVLVEGLPSAKIDGVCFWLDNDSPVVGLSMRQDRIDNFWFVLRHELEHVRQGHGKADQRMILDTELDGENAGTGADVPEEERVANEAAAEFCVPRKQMDAFIARKAPFFSERDMIGFARSLQVHPGIVAGQLQHRTGRYDRFRQHLSKILPHVRTGAATDGWGDVYPVDD